MEITSHTSSLIGTTQRVGATGWLEPGSMTDAQAGGCVDQRQCCCPSPVFMVGQSSICLSLSDSQEVVWTSQSCLWHFAVLLLCHTALIPARTALLLPLSVFKSALES